MYAIEFLATVRNGMIEVPEEYRKHLHNPVRVIVLSDEAKRPDPDLIDQLLEQPLEIADFQPLNRALLYERRYTALPLHSPLPDPAGHLAPPGGR
jgi:hypothetical protein